MDVPSALACPREDGTTGQRRGRAGTQEANRMLNEGLKPVDLSIFQAVQFGTNLLFCVKYFMNTKQLKTMFIDWYLHLRCLLKTQCVSLN